MSKIPLPERGQPLDVTYIYELAKAINDLSTQVASASYNFTTIDNGSSNKETIKTSNAKIIGAYIPIFSNSTVSAGNEKAFTYSFQSEFKFPPIVTATAKNITGEAAGQNVTVVLRDITTSKVDGFVRFNASGNLSLAVNLIAVGLPN
jgi:hypothetical protein